MVSLTHGLRRSSSSFGKIDRTRLQEIKPLKLNFICQSNTMNEYSDSFMYSLKLYQQPIVAVNCTERATTQYSECCECILCDPFKTNHIILVGKYRLVFTSRTNSMKVSLQLLWYTVTIHRMRVAALFVVDFNCVGFSVICMQLSFDFASKLTG